MHARLLGVKYTLILVGKYTRKSGQFTPTYLARHAYIHEVDHFYMQNTSFKHIINLREGTKNIVHVYE